MNSREAELRKLKKRVVEEQDRAAQSESDRRRADVEIQKLKETERSLKEDLDRTKADARNATSEVKELLERINAIGGIFKKK